jgi:hypothetical protein
MSVEGARVGSAGGWMLSAVPLVVLLARVGVGGREAA